MTNLRLEAGIAYKQKHISNRHAYSSALQGALIVSLANSEFQTGASCFAPSASPSKIPNISDVIPKTVVIVLEQGNTNCVLLLKNMILAVLCVGESY